MHELRGASRIYGLDLARGLAIIGMIVAHTGPHVPPFSEISAGYPSTLFAVLCGITITRMHMRADASSGTDLALLRFRDVVRGLLLMGLGVILTPLTSIAVVLGPIGLLYMVLGYLTRLRMRWLVTTALVLLAVQWLVGSMVTTGFFVLALTATASVYPPLAWLAYGILGVIVFRTFSFLRTKAAAWWTVGIVALAGGAAWLRVVLLDDFSSATDPEGYSGAAGFSALHGMSIIPHSGGLLDIAVTATVAVAVFLICMWVCRIPSATRFTLPLHSFGSMALTVYIVHALTLFPLFAFGYTSSPQADFSAEKTSSFSDPRSVMSPSEWVAQFEHIETWPEMIAAEEEAWNKVYENPANDYFEKDLPTPTNPVGIGLIVAGLIFAPLWKSRFRRGPAEWALAMSVARLTSVRADAGTSTPDTAK
ncbi:membrane protein [Corynebacterium renale]|uniref:hypothetical protein n=1 Tax=Corynebacterium renale TaxID=1724 RepID=UPI000DA3E877|nr:hypothetical protein [Corynebacterium renale]SQG65164.1 membrane protein [Corynebacterium renale]STC98145.1 membrane protein [Corynebacterium renale]